MNTRQRIEKLENATRGWRKPSLILTQIIDLDGTASPPHEEIAARIAAAKAAGVVKDDEDVLLFQWSAPEAAEAFGGDDGAVG